MRCSNCGKDVPFAGKVCPWCHVDKSKDQMGLILSGLFGFGGAVLGNLIAGGWGVACGTLLGGVGGLALASKIAADNKRNASGPTTRQQEITGPSRRINISGNASYIGLGLAVLFAAGVIAVAISRDSPDEAAARYAREHPQSPPPAPAAPPDMTAPRPLTQKEIAGMLARQAMASEIETVLVGEMAAESVEVAEGEGKAQLWIRTDLCSQAVVNGMAVKIGKRLRRAGFTEIICQGGKAWMPRIARL